MPDLLLASASPDMPGVIGALLGLLDLIPWVGPILNWLGEPTPRWVALAAILLYFVPWGAFFDFLTKTWIWDLIEHLRRFMEGDRLPPRQADTANPCDITPISRNAGKEGTSDNSSKGALPPGEPQHDPKTPTGKGQQ